jgi:hypothetical protein
MTGTDTDERLLPMRNSTRKTFPVTVTRVPLVRCTVCGRTVANPRSAAGNALTEHYRRAHPEILGDRRD